MAKFKIKKKDCLLTVKAGDAGAKADIGVQLYGDEVIVYYDGNIAESYPLQINTVYANNNVIMSMSTLCLPVSPKLKLTDHGLLTVPGQEHVQLVEKYER